MANEIFTGISALRMLLETETDADSPDNETTYAAMRKAIECLFLLLLGTGDSGSVTTIAETVLTDSGAAYSVDEHNGRTLLMTSGNAKGNLYTIDDTTATTLTCTGDTLVSDGVQVGDDYVILFDVKANTDGHDHDDVNSKNVVLADGSIVTAKYGSGSVDQTAIGASAVGQGELKTSIGSISDGGAGARAQYSLPGGAYGFYPQFKSSSATNFVYYYEMWWNDGSSHGLTTSYVTYIVMEGPGTITQYARQAYVTASGEIHWIFIKKDKATGKTLQQWQAPDHPCYGNRCLEHPFAPFDPKKHEIIVINPSNSDVEKILARQIPMTADGKEDYLSPEKDFMEAFDELFEIEESKEADWPDIPVTVALPRIHKGQVVTDWRFVPQHDADGSKVKIEPVKIVVPKPDIITPLGYKLKK